MRDLGKTSDNVISLVLKDLRLYGRPAELPRLPAGHHLFCGYDQGMGERLFLVETLDDAQQLDDAYANGGALTIRWYSAPVIFTADDGERNTMISWLRRRRREAIRLRQRNWQDLTTAPRIRPVPSVMHYDH